jgi:hypothetical protein
MVIGDGNKILVTNKKQHLFDLVKEKAHFFNGSYIGKSFYEIWMKAIIADPNIQK